jgi:hypothetical protein
LVVVFDVLAGGGVLEVEFGDAGGVGELGPGDRFTCGEQAQRDAQRTRLGVGAVLSVPNSFSLRSAATVLSVMGFGSFPGVIGLCERGYGLPPG